MKPIKLEEAPKELQERIQKHVEVGFELLEVMKEEDSANNSHEATLVSVGHATIINLFGRKGVFSQFVIVEETLDAWVVIEAMKASAPFRNRIKRHIRKIERDIERKEKEQSE
ncbi:hypothetical protein [Bacillus cereus group sp. TH160LC]|uniref:hypothetical protein n=1 Tax=Bacillus cereus group sp. TH160LC TaxID=3018058 RepID=UPI0022E6E45D|nr:hypothetical protein [Bacillus cereus group sp. TH160LC]MDA1651009.1 hypothetical protein [Bacillus cereus group sp. TH160LC]